MIRFIVLCFAIATLISSVLCEIYPAIACTGESECQNCEIKELRVNPCKEIANKKPCKFKKRKTVAIDVDFIPNFASQNVTAVAYWDNGFADVPLPSMDILGCKTTTCPTVPGVQQTYGYKLKIEPVFPPGFYTVKYVLSGDDPKKQKCCFIFKIKIVS